MKLMNLVGDKAYIYGTGNFALRIKHVLHEVNIGVDAFLEINKEISTYGLLPVYKLKEFQNLDKAIPVIIGLGNPQADIKFVTIELESSGFQVINPIQFAICAFNSGYSFENYWLTGDLSLYDKQKNEIALARSFLNDERSKKIFDDVIEYRKTGQIGSLPEKLDVTLQYIAPEFLWSETLANGLDVLDAGSFTGDTYENFLLSAVRINSWTFLEADPQNFDVISQKYASTSKKLNLIHAALSHNSDGVYFDPDVNQNNGSRISAEGSIRVPSITIDALFKNQVFNFIKMDIEGSELNSLVGGKASIDKFRPILAISIYHLTTHHWEIINYLGRSLNLYDFHLGVYGEQTFDVILYAFPSR